jgi:cytochrome bd ubiquinol oxidase subunit I
VFGVGVWYLLALMRHAPHRGEPGPESAPDHPTRAAGITPGRPVRPPHPLRPTGHGSRG